MKFTGSFFQSVIVCANPPPACVTLDDKRLKTSSGVDFRAENR